MVRREHVGMAYELQQLSFLAADQARLMMGQGGMGGGPVPDPTPMLKAEKDNLTLMEHQWALNNAEDTLLKKWNAK